jgi:predicted ATPase/transcriptional regulator with XRE-family HTH domain
VEKERVAVSAFGALLRRHRLAAGLSQDALAERAGMSSVGISALERGDRRSPYRDTVALLAKALRLGPDDAAEFETVAARQRPRKLRGEFPAPVSGTPGPAGFLSLHRTTLVGRQSEIADLARTLSSGRLVTVTGAGGVGKTRIALAVGNILGADTGAIVYLVELAAVTHGSLVAGAVGRALGMQESPNRPPLDALVAYLKQKTLLLIFDNCEHLIEDAALVADVVLRGCPGVRILATSREPLRIGGERTYRLPSLRTPPSADAYRLGAAEAAAFAAIELFVERAQAVDRGFALDDNNAPIVAEICRRLDGIPLAIELAAARMNVLPVRSLSTKLGQRFGLLTNGDRTALARHQTMSALIDWSYDLLTSPEQQLFEGLAMFSGGCTLAAATAVFQGTLPNDAARDGGPRDPDDGAELEILRLLSSLVEKSLATVDLQAPEPRYGMLESSAQYGREKLVARGSYGAVARRHARVYLELADRLERAWETESDSTWYARAEVELPNWRAALEWALVARGDILAGQCLVGLLMHVWHEFATAEGRRWVSLALGLATEQTPSGVAAKLHLTEAHLAASFCRFREALAPAEHARLRFQELGDRDGLAWSQYLAGLPLTQTERPAEAEATLCAALDSARASGSRRKIVGRILLDLGLKLLRDDDYTGSRAAFHEALEIFRSLDADRGVADSLLRLALLEHRRGDWHAALRYSREALEILRACNARVALDALLPVAKFLVKLARYDEAEITLRECLAIAREQQREAIIAFTLEDFVAVAAGRPLADPEFRLEMRKRGARLLGFVDEFFATSGHVPRQPVQQKEYELLAGSLREAVGAETLATLLREGAAMTEDQAVAYAEALFEPKERTAAVRHAAAKNGSRHRSP